MGKMTVRRAGVDQRAPRFNFWPFLHRHDFGNPTAIGMTCRHCRRFTSLALWQLEDMPIEMALCDRPTAPRVSVFEWLTGSMNCAPNPVDKPLTKQYNGGRP